MNVMSDECACSARIMHHTCRVEGVPVEEEKLESPATTITFLGIEIDTKAMEIRLPQDKLAQMQQALTLWRGKKAFKRSRELERTDRHAHTAIHPAAMLSATADHVV